MLTDLLFSATGYTCTVVNGTLILAFNPFRPHAYVFTASLLLAMSLMSLTSLVPLYSNVLYCDRNTYGLTRAAEYHNV